MVAPAQSKYSFNERSELVPFIPGQSRRVLDVGCARGGFGATLRAQLGPDAYLMGIDAVPESVEQSRASGCYDEVIQGYFPDDLPTETEPFDLIVFADVLEHMYDPWAAVAAAGQSLAPGGRVLASLPSIQFGPVLWQLIKGRWDYADEGTLDRTHIRFFTQATMRELFENAGYRVEQCVGINPTAELIIANAKTLKARVKGHLLHRLPAYNYLQYAIVASRPS